MRPLHALLITSCLLAAPAWAQKEAASTKKSRDPKIAEQLKDFKAALAEKKFLGDDRAIGIIDTLLEAWPEMHPKDRKDSLKAIEKVFKGKKRKPGTPALYQAAVVALGSMGPDSGKILAKIYDRPPFGNKPRDWISMRELVLESAGRSKDEKQIKFLLDEATRGYEDRIKAAAGKALGQFAESDFKVRKEIVSKLLVDYGRIEGDTKSNQFNDPQVITRKRTLGAIADPWNRTLSRLTGQQFRTSEEWYAWYNKHKNSKKGWGG